MMNRRQQIKKSKATNKERAASALQAIEAVTKYDPYDPDSIVDLVTDLLHLAQQVGTDPEYVIRTAKIHYDAEVEKKKGAAHG
jgi:hypothetical protein